MKLIAVFLVVACFSSLKSSEARPSSDRHSIQKRGLFDAWLGMIWTFIKPLLLVILEMLKGTLSPGENKILSFRDDGSLDLGSLAQNINETMSTLFKSLPGHLENMYQKGRDLFKKNFDMVASTAGLDKLVSEAPLDILGGIEDAKDWFGKKIDTMTSELKKNSVKVPEKVMEQIEHIKSWMGERIDKMTDEVKKQNELLKEGMTKKKTKKND